MGASRHWLMGATIHWIEWEGIPAPAGCCDDRHRMSRGCEEAVYLPMLISSAGGVLGGPARRAERCYERRYMHEIGD
jgi:hypothetical protein